MNALDLVKAANAAGSVMVRNPTFLIYGFPKEGKTRLAATIAKMRTLDQIYWFNCENGFDTVITMYEEGILTEEDLAKITIINIADTREEPLAIETMLKSLCTRNAVQICEAHGRVACQTCAKEGKPSITFQYSALTSRNAVVIDSLSQVGSSAMNLACLGKDVKYKPQLDDYGACGKYLTDLCTVIQTAAYCPIFAITHVHIEESKDTGAKLYYPLCGTSSFSVRVSKYFGNVIWTQRKMKKHSAISSTMGDATTTAGSRLGLQLEKMQNPDLSILLENGDTVKEAVANAIASTESAAQVAVTTEKQKPAFLTRK